ncbi:protein phosphatase 1 regulatory subunit 37-like isoform X3 [Anneissia japonica]|uniref:protein phosphatase 1 regulatory subunit 37-like isoform X3 n=1 Tax=Anneissia japonica TaxID=1529436 RepID=UPI00142562C2|nr:protein phosphatase 1 regulatory subunit 37-like isoform X3 [Anneissia japonica]
MEGEIGTNTLTSYKSILSPTTSKSKLKLPGRRVNFPQDEKLISNTLDPPDPWQNVQSPTKEELLSNYQSACARLKIKPSAKMLNLIQNTTDFKSRIETLQLKGEKMDMRTIEAMESILSRIQFQTIDLELCNLDDESSAALFDMVEFYESAIKLVVASNRNIGIRGWQAAGRMMKKTSCLEHLDVRNTVWSEPSIQALARAVRNDISVNIIHIENCNLTGRPLFILTLALKLNQTLRDIFLAENRLVASDAIQLGSMLKHNKGLKLLDLRNNHLQDVGLSHLCDGLVDQEFGHLSTLVLWNNQITHLGMRHLAKALPQLTTLETLNLGQNNIGNEGIHTVKDALMKNHSLLRLGLYQCRISDEGAVALAECLADNCQMVRLDVRQNDIRTGGLMALAHALRVNKTLLRLDLDREVKKDSTKGYDEIQRSLQQEIAVYLHRNRESTRQAEEQRQALLGQQTKPDENIPSPSSEAPRTVSMGTNINGHISTFVQNRGVSTNSSEPYDDKESDMIEREITDAINDVDYVGNTNRKKDSKKMAMHSRECGSENVGDTSHMSSFYSPNSNQDSNPLLSQLSTEVETNQSIRHPGMDPLGVIQQSVVGSPPGIRITGNIKLLTQPSGIKALKRGEQVAKGAVNCQSAGASSGNPGATPGSPGVPPDKPGASTYNPGAPQDQPGISPDKPCVTSGKPEGEHSKPVNLLATQSTTSGNLAGLLGDSQTRLEATTDPQNTKAEAGAKDSTIESSNTRLVVDKTSAINLTPNIPGGSITLDTLPSCTTPCGDFVDTNAANVSDKCNGNSSSSLKPSANELENSKILTPGLGAMEIPKTSLVVHDGERLSSSPDDFEKELSQMLANARSGMDISSIVSAVCEDDQLFND